MQQIATAEMSPVHVGVARAVRVVLEEDVVPAVVVDEPVRVVDPAERRAQVQRRQMRIPRIVRHVRVPFGRFSGARDQA
jgi:hypothetical protein